MSKAYNLWVAQCASTYRTTRRVHPGGIQLASTVIHALASPPQPSLILMNVQDGQSRFAPISPCQHQATQVFIVHARTSHTSPLAYQVYSYEADSTQYHGTGRWCIGWSTSIDHSGQEVSLVSPDTISQQYLSISSLRSTWFSCKRSLTWLRWDKARKPLSYTLYSVEYSSIIIMWTTVDLPKPDWWSTSERPDHYICGANAHHQNGVAEKRIGDLQEAARTSFIHTKQWWPGAIESYLWSYVLQFVESNRLVPIIWDWNIRLESWVHQDFGWRDGQTLDYMLYFICEKRNIG